jgi:hypothetical protein
MRAVSLASRASATSGIRQRSINKIARNGKKEPRFLIATSGELAADDEAVADAIGNRDPLRLIWRFLSLLMQSSLDKKSSASSLKKWIRKEPRFQNRDLERFSAIDKAVADAIENRGSFL